MFLESSRLILERLTPEHLEFLFPLHHDPQVMKYIRKPDATIEETRTTIERLLAYTHEHHQFGLFPAFLKEKSNEFIGWGILLHLENNPKNDVEIGYRLLPKFWKKGYATEIAKTLIHYGFETVGLTKIVGVTDPANEDSKKVLLKCGLSFSGTASYYGKNVNVFARITNSIQDSFVDLKFPCG